MGTTTIENTERPRQSKRAPGSTDRQPSTVDEIDPAELFDRDDDIHRGELLRELRTFLQGRREP